MNRAQPGTVYLVGAGPGDPGLLTLRAHQLLQTATHILPDGLISAEVLQLAHADATVIPVGKLVGRPRITQEAIHILLVDLARAGHSVVRLKSGDPMIFGRAGEELAALRSADIAFEVVPGITAASAAAATLQIPLTDRTYASKLILATAHHAANKLEVDADPQSIWKGPLPADATLVLYMPGPDFEQLAQSLMDAGISPDVPVVAISRVSRVEQRTHRTTLGALRSADCGAAPVLLLLGRSVASAPVDESDATEAPAEAEL